MNYAVTMSLRQSVCHVLNDLNGTRDCNLVFVQKIAQRLSINQFHDDERKAFGGLAVIVDGRNVGVAQARRGACFAQEASFEMVFVRGGSGKKLYGYLTAQMRVFCQIDDTHAALAELFKNTVMRDCLADHCCSGFYQKSGRSETLSHRQPPPG